MRASAITNKADVDLYELLASNMSSYRDREYGHEENPYGASETEGGKNDLLFATEVDTEGMIFGEDTENAKPINAL